MFVYFRHVQRKTFYEAMLAISHRHLLIAGSIGNVQRSENRITKDCRKNSLAIAVSYNISCIVQEELSSTLTRKYLSHFVYCLAKFLNSTRHNFTSILSRSIIISIAITMAILIVGRIQKCFKFTYSISSCE